LTAPDEIIYIATSSAGKLRDFAALAKGYGVRIEPMPGFATKPTAVEDGATFEENAVKKAVHYSRFAVDAYVVADDSGLAVDALGGAPGVHSARYAALGQEQSPAKNSQDEANNAKLLQELATATANSRAAKYVAVLTIARAGEALESFTGEVSGTILEAPRGSGGFGYDPLFCYEPWQKTFAEATPEEKAKVSHRGQAFRKLLEWYSRR
jgi:XTP/dITP diphosphohydrolase